MKLAPAEKFLAVSHTKAELHAYVLEMEAQNRRMRGELQQIADQDYRGSRPSASVNAEACLREIDA